MEDYDVVMWDKHGVFAKGLDVMDAFDQIDVLSKSAKIYIDSKCTAFSVSIGNPSSRIKPQER